MSRLTRIALQNRSVVALAVVAVLVAGVFAAVSLKQELIPNLNFPYLTILTVDPGAAATDVERDVTTPIEQAIKSSAAIKTLQSYSNDGLSIIMAEYEFGTDMDQAQSELQASVARVQPMLPQGAQAPTVAKFDFGSTPVVQLAVTSELPARQLALLLNTRVVPELQAISGVEAVTLSGAQTEQLLIELRPEAMTNGAVAPEAIVGAIQGANLAVGAGSLDSGSLVVPVTVRQAATTARAYRKLVIGPAGGSQSTAGAGSAAAVRLGDIATVSVAPAPVTALTRTDGEPSVGISISKSRDGNTVRVASAIQDALPGIRAALGEQTTVTVVQDQATFITASIRSMWHEGFIGALFAVLVIWAFLRNWRSTIIAGVSIPLSVLGALIILWSRGDSLNMLTLGGLTIAIGRVIDDSIVVIENAYRHLQEGDDARTAAYTATREVAGAITASTLTTVAVFLPLGFIEGLSSEFFRPFAWTVTFALLASLLVALTVIPVMVTWLLNKKLVGHREADDTTRIQRAYLPPLKWALSHKLVTLGLALIAFLGTMALAPLLSTNLFDNSTQNTMTVIQQLPPGTSLETTSSAAEKIEAVLDETSGIEVYQVTMGSTGSLFGPGGGTTASSSQATFTVTTDPEVDKMTVMDEVREGVAQLDDVGTVTVSGEDSSMGTGSAVEVQVTADDPAVLSEANAQVLAAVENVDGLVDVKSSLSADRQQVAVQVDQEKATAAGVTAAAVGQYVTLITDGYPLGTVPSAGGPIPATIAVPGFTVPPLPGATAMVVEKLPMPGTAGMVPIGSIAKVAMVEAPVQITHVGARRTATISATVADNNIGAASGNVQTALDGVTLPEGAEWKLAGASQQTEDVFRTLGIAMVIAVMLVYIIMVATFRSLLNPLILLVSIPFAGVGAVILLLVTGTSLGMVGMIGALMLVGIVVTNAIVLLDLIEQFRRQGMAAYEAVIEGGRRRLRPILMTAFATILALTPMALGFGEGSFLSAQLAIVVIGGLFSSTMLTLIIVPVLYLALDRLRSRRPGADPATLEAGAAEV